MTIGNHVFGTFACDFATKDGRRIFVTSFTRNHWTALKRATGSNEYFANFEAEHNTDLTFEENRYKYRGMIEKTLSPWFASKTLAQLKTILNKEKVCWGPYQSFRQAVHEDPDLSTQNPIFEDIFQPGIGKFRAAGSFINFTGLPRQPVKPAPKLGQNTDEILASYLKLSDKQIGLLHDRGIVSGPESF